MRIRSEITTDETAKEECNFYQRGVLNLPLTIMLPFGLLGFRPGQLFNKIIGYLINAMFFFNSILIFVITVGRLYNISDYDSTFSIFYTGYVVAMTIKFTFLIHIYFKKNNFLCLSE